MNATIFCKLVLSTLVFKRRNSLEVFKTYTSKLMLSFRKEKKDDNIQKSQAQYQTNEH